MLELFYVAAVLCCTQAGKWTKEASVEFAKMTGDKPMLMNVSVGSLKMYTP